MAKVAIMDDCSLFRGGLKALLTKSGEHDVCWETGDPTHALQMLSTRVVRTLVFDPYFHGKGNGLCFLETIRRQFPNVSLLVCTACLRDDLWLSTMQSGASGFLLKNCTDREIILAIRQISAGDNYFMDNVKERIVTMFMMNRSLNNGHAVLSLRQRQVVERLIEGDAEKEIANSLALSASTVATYLARALQALGLKNKVQLIRFAEGHPEILGTSHSRNGERHGRNATRKRSS